MKQLGVLITGGAGFLGRALVEMLLASGCQRICIYSRNYLNPSTAAQGLLKMHSLPYYHHPLPNDPYPDLSTFEIFR